jgi:DNA-binding transcriptional LysR family regulator
MQGRDLNLRHLRAFEAVCAHGSVSAAAHHVHLSQPAISQALAKLDKALAAKLFHRAQSGLSPTGLGAIFLNRTTRALSILRAGCDRAALQQCQARNTPFDQAITATQLKALTSVAAYGNFSVAARRQSISQPALYRVARDLEHTCGFVLFEKTSGGISLTHGARHLVRAAKLAFRELDQGIEEVAHSQGADTASITIASLPLARSTVLPKAIAALTKDRLSVAIKVVDGPYDDLLHALREGDVDLMIGALRDPVPAEDVVQEELFRDALGIYCGAAHPLVGRSRVTSDDLVPYPWALPKAGTPTRSEFDAFAARAGLAPQTVRVETSSMILIRGLLNNSHSLTMISATQVEEDVRMGSLYRLPVAFKDRQRPVGFTYRTAWQPTATQIQFMQLVRLASQPPRNDAPQSAAVPSATWRKPGNSRA